MSRCAPPQFNLLWFLTENAPICNNPFLTHSASSIHLFKYLLVILLDAARGGSGRWGLGGAGVGVQAVGGAYWDQLRDQHLFVPLSNSVRLHMWWLLNLELA